MNLARMACDHVARNEQVYALDSMEEDVACSLVSRIVDLTDFDQRPDNAISEGVAEAMCEIEAVDFNDAVEQVQQAVFDEVEIEAKKIALRLLRELAGKYRQKTAEPCEAATA